MFGAWAFTLLGHPGLLQQIRAVPARHLVSHTLGIAHASLWEGDSHCRAQFLNSHSHKVRLWFQKPRLCVLSWEGVLCELPQAGPPLQVAAAPSLISVLSTPRRALAPLK